MVGESFIRNVEKDALDPCWWCGPDAFTDFCYFFIECG